MRSAAGRVRRLGVALLGALSLAAASPVIERGDAAWADRARGEMDGRPQLAPVREAIRAYEAALEARPDDLSARWKLLRSLHFAATFVVSDPEAQRPYLERASVVSEAGLDRLAQQVGQGTRIDELPLETLPRLLAVEDVEIADVARFYFWSALCWGSWSQSAGLLTAVREGVGNRLYRYTNVTLALEPEYEDGGAYRLLGRLHAALPSIPLLSGWVDRDRALPLIERARAMAPEHPGNQLLLALTLLDLAPARRDEAVALLRRVAKVEPRPGARIEDASLRQEARAQLAELDAPL